MWDATLGSKKSLYFSGPMAGLKILLSLPSRGGPGQVQGWGMEGSGASLPSGDGQKGL